MTMKRFIACLLLLCLIALPALAESGITMNFAKYAMPKEVPDHEALRFTHDMGVGFNLGNTFDTNDTPWIKNDLDIETGWGNPKTTKEMIVTLKEAGFSTLRLPVSWHDHVNDDFIINTPWLDRVQEVVDYAYDEGMYVILNTHHDVSKKFYYPSSEHMETSSRYIQTIWSQLAERFKDYDHHLIFESMNEPRLKDTDHEWAFHTNCKPCQDSADCINQLNQLFVDTVRASGGNNADRYLMVPTYAAATGNSNLDALQLPKDAAENRIIVSVHAYTPYDFALNPDGGDKFPITQTAEIVTFMNRLYNRYIVNGIPVVIGEFGALNKKDNLQARVDFTSFYVACAAGRGIPCCWWDNGNFTGNGEKFGLLNRRNCTFAYPEIKDAIVLNGMK